MTEADQKLMHEILKKIQDGQARIEATLAEHTEQFKAVRHMLAAMQSDDFRNEAAIASVRVDLDRIKRRLELTDA